MTNNAGTLVKGGRKIGTGSRGQLRDKELTQCLISILNEIDPTDPKQKAKMYRVCENLVTQATVCYDKMKMRQVTRKKNGKVESYEVKTNEIEEKGMGELMAIKEIFDRVDGKPKQTIVGPNDGPVVIEYHGFTEIKVGLLQQGIDIDALPAPTEALTHIERDDDD